MSRNSWRSRQTRLRRVEAEGCGIGLLAAGLKRMSDVRDEHSTQARGTRSKVLLVAATVLSALNLMILVALLDFAAVPVILIKAFPLFLAPGVLGGLFLLTSWLDWVRRWLTVPSILVGALGLLNSPNAFICAMLSALAPVR